MKLPKKLRAKPDVACHLCLASFSSRPRFFHCPASVHAINSVKESTICWEVIIRANVTIWIYRTFCTAESGCVTGLDSTTAWMVSLNTSSGSSSKSDSIFSFFYTGVLLVLTPSWLSSGHDGPPSATWCKKSRVSGKRPNLYGIFHTPFHQIKWSAKHPFFTILIVYYLTWHHPIYFSPTSHLLCILPSLWKCFYVDHFLVCNELMEMI